MKKKMTNTKREDAGNRVRIGYLYTSVILLVAIPLFVIGNDIFRIIIAAILTLIFGAALIATFSKKRHTAEYKKLPVYKKIFYNMAYIGEIVSYFN